MIINKKNILKRLNFIFLTAFIYSILLIRNNLAIGNPIPIDINWETSPVSTNYNNSVIFKQEIVNVTFDSLKANINAFYTFKNIGITAQDLGILLPFINYKGASTGPEDVQLLLNDNEIYYIWQNIDNIWEYGDKTYRAISFNLSFNPYEEKMIQIKYYRDYMIYDSIYNREAYYHFNYLVGTARNWNHPIQSAYFEFWIPKQICDDFEWPPYVNITGNNVKDTVKEFANYYFASLEFENWTLPTYESNIGWVPAFDFISLHWTKTRSSGFDTTVIFIFSVFQTALIGFCILIIPSYVVYHKKKHKYISSTFILASSTVALITGAIFIILGLLQPSYLLAIGIVTIIIGFLSLKYTYNFL